MEASERKEGELEEEKRREETRREEEAGLKDNQESRVSDER